MKLLIRYRYIFYLLALLPAFWLRDATPDNELKYLSIVDQALREGTIWTFHNHAEVYADKPPLYFWLMMAARALGGEHHMWVLGLFSLLPAVGTMMVMDRWMRVEGRERNASLGAALLGTTMMFTASALVVRMDMLMTFFITLTLYTFFRLYKGVARPRERWLLPVWLFLAIFSKGPMGAMIPLLSMAAFLLFRRELRFMGRWFGWRQWLILTGLCAAWWGMVWVEGGQEYLNNILFKQTVGRGIDSFHHKQHLFWYLPRMLYTFAPWTLLYIAVVCTGVWRRLMTTDTEKFLHVAVWTNVLMLSIVSAKLDIYMLPLYPLVAYLAASLVGRIGSTPLLRVCVAVPAVIFLLLWPASLFVKPPVEGLDMLLPRIGAGVASLAGALALLGLWRKRLRIAIWYVAAGMVAMVFVASFSLPQINGRIGLRELAREAEATGADGYAWFGYRPFADMDVYLGREVAPVYYVSRLDSLAADSVRTGLFIRSRDVARNDSLRTRLADRALDRQYYFIVLGGRTRAACF
jgi:4-amino-4-deoxy-L-arabinose transferase-like glycosyltransferase